MKVQIFLFLFLSISANGCFIVPKIKIYQAFKAKNCQKLSTRYIYDLSQEQLKESVDLCLKKKKYQTAMIFLEHLEKKTLSLDEKFSIWKKKALIHRKFLFQYPQAIKELEKILQHKSEDHSIKLTLIELKIKNQSFESALKDTQKLLVKEMDQQKKLNLKFIQARLLLLLHKKKESLEIFLEIKKENPRFFKKNQGPFYTALLLEEEKRFLEAIEELENTGWPFAGDKNKHWRERESQAPRSRR